jgi:hypothetical protein
MPGVGFSPHGARYGFATDGERDLGFMMTARVDWCDEWTAKAIADDRALLDADLMDQQIRDRLCVPKT